jgi:hypothetical protein
MKIQHSIAEPIRQGLSWSQRWQSADEGLIACWERGRNKGYEEPELADKARAGQLMVLPWKGGVERALKAKKKFGSFNYLAMWQGLRQEDLSIDTDSELSMTCTATGMQVVYTNDREKYAEG